jgi:hypothetical protein
MEFETTDPAMLGEMIVTYTLTDAGGGTDVLAVHDMVPLAYLASRQRNRLANGTRQTRSIC